MHTYAWRKHQHLYAFIYIFIYIYTYILASVKYIHSWHLFTSLLSYSRYLTKCQSRCPAQPSQHRPFAASDGCTINYNICSIYLNTDRRCVQLPAILLLFLQKHTCTLFAKRFATTRVATTLAVQREATFYRTFTIFAALNCLHVKGHT